MTNQQLEDMIALYGGAVKTICINILGFENRQDIEECISDVFVELWKNYDNFNLEKGGLKSYIYGIARHKAIDMLRRDMRRRNHIILEDADINVEIDFENEVAKKKNASILKEVIDSLPSPDREIFIYRYYLFEKIKTISEKLKLTPKQVENKLYRGKDQLRKQLLERGVVL